MSTSSPFGDVGYTCGVCGYWVAPGAFHNCYGTPKPVTPVSNTTVNYWVDYGRIADALERIADALEKIKA